MTEYRIISSVRQTKTVHGWQDGKVTYTMEHRLNFLWFKWWEPVYHLVPRAGANGREYVQLTFCNLSSAEREVRKRIAQETDPEIGTSRTINTIVSNS